MRTIITGATKGIGRAITFAFAKEGSDLALCARTEADLQSLQQELNAQFPKIEVLIAVADLSNKKDVLGFGEFVLSHWQHIDILINNAGVYIGGAIAEEAEGNLEKMIETNLYSAYYLTRAILPSLLTQKKGHIFNMCSIASLFAYPNGGSYSISKFALLGFSKVLREELKDKGIRVTSILPGATWSNSWAGVDLPYERLMPAEDIAKAVLSAYQLSGASVIEEIIIRPQLGDL